MKVILQQKGSVHKTREEVLDSLPGMEAISGCVFAYADFNEMRVIGFFEVSDKHSAIPTVDQLTSIVGFPQSWRGQRWVVVTDDGSVNPDAEDRIKARLE